MRRQYFGVETEGQRDALKKYIERSLDAVSQAPGMLPDHAQLEFMKATAGKQPFPLQSYLGPARIIQNSDGTFPYMPGYDGPSQA